MAESASTGRLVVTGALAGACAGLVVGALEAAWLVTQSSGGSLGSALALVGWGAVAYAVASAPLGVAAALGARGLATIVRFVAGLEVGLAAAFVFVVGAVLVGRARYYSDVPPSAESGAERLLVLAIAAGAGAVLGLAALALERRGGVRALLAGCVGVASLAAGASLATVDGEAPTTAGAPPADVPADGPHVLLIVADTLGASYLKAYAPDAPADTPTLDALAADGIVLEHCAGSSWTKPSFGSILTGLPPRSHTALDRHSRLPDEAETLAEVFAAHGYRTLGFSNTNPNNSSDANFAQGFQHFEDLTPSDAWLGAPWPATRLRLYEAAIEPLARLFIGVRIHHFYEPADAYTDLVLDRLRQGHAPDSKRPLFATLHYMDPHTPFMGGRLQGPPQNGMPFQPSPDDPSPDAMRRGYVADIEFMDRHLARLVDGLRELGLYDEAVIVFTSDHGEELFEHDSWGHGDSLYGEVLRVPLIVKLPGSAGAGSVGRTLTQHVDIAPTLLALAGVPAPEAMVGRALLDADGNLDERPGAHCFSTLVSRGNDMDASRTRDASWIKTEQTEQERIEPLEFYDLRSDPGEQRNLADSTDPERVAEREALDRALEQAVEAAEAARIGADGGDEMESDAELDARLRALGYVE